MAALSEPIFHQLTRGGVNPQSTIIAVGGGKGGIGKSFLSSSLAIFLAQMGHETYLVDLDLGAANLHTTIGEGQPRIGINEFLTDPSLSLQDVAAQTAFPNLRLISGCTEVFGTADIDDQQRSRLMSALHGLKTDFIVLDLSAGTHAKTLDFFMMATHKVLVFTPEPSSIENAYRFLKAGFYRKIKRFEHQFALHELINDLMSNRQRYGLRSPGDLLKLVTEKDPDNGFRLQQVMNQLNVEVILNQTRSLRDIQLGPSIQNVCSKYFGIPCSYLGHIEYDNAVWQSLRKRRHLLVEYPHSRVYPQTMAITRRLAAPLSGAAMVV